MAIFHTVWSVDLGKASLKAVKLRREKNNLEILDIDKIDYPIGLNGVDSVQQAKEALNAFKIRKEVREPVVVAHPGQGTFSRFIKVPAFEAKKLKEMVGYEASQQIPFPLDEVIWDYHLVNREYLSGEEREVGIFAVRREAIDDYLLDFTTEGLSVEVLSIGYLGLLNYIFFDLTPQEPSIVVDIGATHTDLILVDGKKFWIRALPHSGNDINKAIMERFKLSFQEAEKLKIESAKAPQQAVKIFSTVIQPKLKELIGEIHRSIGYYRSQSGDVKFQHLYLLGNGSKIIGIKKYLSEQLGVQVNRVQSIRHFRVNRDVNLRLLQQELPAFGTAFGCALQGVGVGSCKVDLVPQEERIQKDLRRKRKHAFIAMGIVYAMIILSGWILAGRIEKSQGEKKEHQTWLKTEIYPNDPARVSRDSKRGSDEEAPVEISVFEKQWTDLSRVAEIRPLAMVALRTLGTVVPKANSELKVFEDIVTNKAAAERKAEQEIAQLNQKRLFIPYLRIEKVEWPEEEEVTGAAVAKERARERERKTIPTVPAYKVTVFAAVCVQSTVDESLKLLRKLLVEPMKRELQKNLPGGILLRDPEVKDSPEFKRNLLRLHYLPDQRSAEFNDFERRLSGGARVKSREIEDTPQDAGPFFGTEVIWYLRLRDPEEVVEEPEEDRGGGRPPRPPR